MERIGIELTENCSGSIVTGETGFTHTGTAALLVLVVFHDVV